MPSPLVVFDNVVKRFGPFVAVKRMNFEINEGEFLAFMGPSGCGKTTTLRMLAGLEQPSEGDIRLAGTSLLNVKPHERDTPMVWQSLALFPFLNARENVEFGLKMRGIDKAKRRTKALDWLERLGIGEFAERDVGSLSGGQRQRTENPTAGRAALGARCTSRHPHAGRAHQAAARTRHHLRLCHALAVGGLRHG